MTHLLLPVLALVLVFAAGCGASAPQQARTALDVTSLGVAAADGVAADLPPCADADATCIEHRVSLQDAIDTARAGIVAGYAYVAGAASSWASSTWQRIASCTAAAVQLVLTTLTAFGVPIPPLLTSAVNYVAQFVGPCTLTLRARVGGAS